MRRDAPALLALALAALAPVARAAGCRDITSCSACIAAPNCGQCLLPPTTREGVRIQEQACLEGNSTAPFDAAAKCVHWSNVACSCPLDCNQHGKCGEEGKCACAPGWTGSGCAREAKVHGRPEVLVPLALFCALVLVGILVGAQLVSNSDRCWNRRRERKEEDKPMGKPYEHPGLEGEAGAAEGLLNHRRG